MRVFTLPRRAVLACIELYQRRIRRVLPSACRFIPSCSEYARQAIHKYGILKGAPLALKRILRCHPFSKKSGLDPLL